MHERTFAANFETEHNIIGYDFSWKEGSKLQRTGRCKRK